MKRFHVHVGVTDLAVSVRFYSALFAAPPTIEKPDYAKWMLEDPRVNFAISTHGSSKGVDHLGIQAEDEGELREIYGHLKSAEGAVLDEGATTCCYAKSEKSWIADPQGIAWETFHTTGESTVYGAAANLKKLSESACCAPPIRPEPKASSCGCNAAAE